MLASALAVVAVTVGSAHPSAQPDPATVLQSLIDAHGPGVVDIPAGYYRLGAPVVVPERTCLRGAGPSTVLVATGNQFAVSLRGNWSCLSDVRIVGETQQTGGGGVSFAEALRNNSTHNLVFGDNLWTGIDIAPLTDNQGIYQIVNSRWDGIFRSRTGIRVGDGLRHLTDVHILGVSGTAATPTDMGTWIDVLPDTDTVRVTGCTFINGGTGIRIGSGGAPGSVTGITINDCPAIEGQSYGVLALSALNLRMQNLSLAQNAVTAIGLGAGVRGAYLLGSVLHANRADGMTIWPGATGVSVIGNLIEDNNQDGSPWGYGISIAGGVSRFILANNTIRNGSMWLDGKTRYGIYLAPGVSHTYSITFNQISGMTVSNAVIDGGTGTKKVVTGNY